MRYVTLAMIAAIISSTAPAFAQNKDTGDVSIKATEAPIDRTATQNATIAPGSAGVGGSAPVVKSETGAPAPTAIDSRAGKTQ